MAVVTRTVFLLPADHLFFSSFLFTKSAHSHLRMFVRSCMTDSISLINLHQHYQVVVDHVSVYWRCWSSAVCVIGQTVFQWKLPRKLKLSLLTIVQLTENKSYQLPDTFATADAPLQLFLFLFGCLRQQFSMFVVIPRRVIVK